jgi:hypothetical protein
MRPGQVKPGRFYFVQSIVYNLELSVSCSVGSANNMNKLSLVGMQLPEKYKENFGVSCEDP